MEQFSHSLSLVLISLPTLIVLLCVIVFLVGVASLLSQESRPSIAVTNGMSEDKNC